jgi:hypothetical protein
VGQFNCQDTQTSENPVFRPLEVPSYDLGCRGGRSPA